MSSFSFLYFQLWQWWLRTVAGIEYCHFLLWLLTNHSTHSYIAIKSFYHLNLFLDKKLKFPSEWINFWATCTTCIKLTDHISHIIRTLELLLNIIIISHTSDHSLSNLGSLGCLNSFLECLFSLSCSTRPTCSKILQQVILSDGIDGDLTFTHTPVLLLQCRQQPKCTLISSKQ